VRSARHPERRRALRLRSSVRQRAVPIGRVGRALRDVRHNQRTRRAVRRFGRGAVRTRIAVQRGALCAHALPRRKLRLSAGVPLRAVLHGRPMPQRPRCGRDVHGRAPMRQPDLPRLFRGRPMRASRGRRRVREVRGQALRTGSVLRPDVRRSRLQAMAARGGGVRPTFVAERAPMRCWPELRRQPLCQGWCRLVHIGFVAVVPRLQDRAQRQQPPRWLRRGAFAAEFGGFTRRRGRPILWRTMEMGHELLRRGAGRLGRRLDARRFDKRAASSVVPRSAFLVSTIGRGYHVHCGPSAAPS
jgi:hypothetical protein